MNATVWTVKRSSRPPASKMNVTVGGWVFVRNCHLRALDADGGLRGLALQAEDLFWIKEAPGKTLVVGAAYIALAGGVQVLVLGKHSWKP